MILVSHDRDFLDRTVTSTIAPANPEAPDGRWIEYAGGYSDMLAQRKASAERREAKAEKPTGQEPTCGGSGAMRRKRKGKLSYKQKFALENLPKEMAEGEARSPSARRRWPIPDLFTKDPAAFNRLAAEMEKLRESLTKMEEEWLELEMLREELEG